MRIIASSAVHRTASGGAWGIALLLVAVPALSGCERSGHTEAAAPAPVRPTYDGVYRGRSVPAIADSRCGQGGPITLLVMGSKFYFRWTPQVNLEVLVGEDGSLRGQPVRPGPAASLNGAISGDQLRAEMGDATCRYRLELNRA